MLSSHWIGIYMFNQLAPGVVLFHPLTRRVILCSFPDPAFVNRVQDFTWVYLNRSLYWIVALWMFCVPRFPQITVFYARSNRMGWGWRCEMPLSSPLYRWANRGQRWEGTGGVAFSSWELESGFEHDLRLQNTGCRAAGHLPSRISHIRTLGSLEGYPDRPWRVFNFLTILLSKTVTFDLQSHLKGPWGFLKHDVMMLWFIINTFGFLPPYWHRAPKTLAISREWVRSFVIL